MKKILKRSVILFLVLLLACSTGAFVDNAQNVSAKTVKAKKLKMKKKKVTVTVGKKVKLGVSVKPKKAKIKWSSNKKKIATVSKKGVVKGIKEGTAKVTAKSGKKKAVCTVKVKAKPKKKAAPAGIKAVTVLNAKAVRVTLTKSVSLSTANFSVRKKLNGKGAYNTVLKIGSVTKVSDTVYDVILDTDITILDTYEVDDTNCLESGDYVQVTVSRLSGAKTGETVYYASRYARNSYREWMVGEDFEEGFGFSQSKVGYVSDIKVSGVPDGLTAKVYGETVYVSGTPTVAKASVMTFTGKDEMGQNLTQKVYFYIGSESVMLCYTELEKRTILINDGMSEWFEIHTVGGSGSYTVSLNGNTNKIIRLSGKTIVFDSYGTDSATGKKVYLNPGTYDVSYTVKDDSGHSCKGKLSVVGVKGITVSGKVTAEDNTGIGSAMVYASFDDEKHMYYLDTLSTGTSSEGDYDYSSGVKRKAGDYSFTLYPSQLYDFHAQKASAARYIHARQTGTSNMTLSFKLPIYKITMACGEDDLSDVAWKNVSTDMTQGYGNTLYLKKGTYKLAGTSKLYSYAANFTVNGNRTATAKRTNEVTAKAILTEGQQITSSITGGDGSIYAFTPAVSGSYEFICDSATSMNARLFDAATAKQMDYDTNSHYVSDGDGGYHYEYGEVKLTGELTAGKTYYLYTASGYSDVDMTIVVNSVP